MAIHPNTLTPYNIAILFTAVGPLFFSRSSLTSTTLSVTWSQANIHIPLQDYEISLFRLNGSDQELCDTFTDNRLPMIISANKNTMMFTGLREFSTYRLKLVARFQAPDRRITIPYSQNFHTYSACME